MMRFAAFLTSLGTVGAVATVAAACGGSSGAVFGVVGSDGGTILDGGDVHPESCPIQTPRQWLGMSSVDAPTARSGATATWTGDKALFFGGVGTRQLFDGALYDPCTDRWTPVDAAPDTQDVNTTLLPTPIWTGSKFVLWGGVIAGPPPKTALAAVFDPGSRQWTAMGRDNEPALARAGGVHVWTGDKLFAWGASQGSADGGLWDPATNTWSKMGSSGAPSSITNPQGVWAGDRVFVWGEVYPQPGPGQHKFIGGAYDPKIDAWSALSAQSAPQGDGAHVLWIGSKVLVWAQPNQSNSDQVLRALYDFNSSSWTALRESPDITALKLESAAPIWTGHEVVVFGNSSDGKIAGLMYDPNADTWRRTTMIDAPTGYGYQTRAASGRILLTMPGSTNGLQNATAFFVFDPTANSWTSAGTLSARTDAAVAWTGRRIIAWGGKDIEIDPNGDDGCGNPTPGVGCDPITPTKTSLRGDGSTYGIP